MSAGMLMLKTIYMTHSFAVISVDTVLCKEHPHGHYTSRKLKYSNIWVLQSYLQMPML